VREREAGDEDAGRREAEWEKKKDMGFVYCLLVLLILAMVLYRGEDPQNVWVGGGRSRPTESFPFLPFSSPFFPALRSRPLNPARESGERGLVGAPTEIEFLHF